MSKSIIAILIANLIWGMAPPIFKYSLQDIPPFTLGFIRFFGAALLFLPFLPKSRNKISKAHWRHIVLGAIWGISINISFFFPALKLAPSINAHIINSFGPILLYVLSLFVLRERAHPQILRGMVIAALGIGIIIFAPLIGAYGQSFTVGSSSISVLVGNLMFVVATLGGVFIAVENKQIVGRVHPVLLTCLQFFIGSLAFIPFMYWELQSWSFASMTAKSWVGIVFGLFFSSGVAYFAQNYALVKLKAQEIAVFGYIMPVVAVLVAIPLLGEKPDIYFIAGSILIFVGVIVSERHPHFHKVHQRLRAKS